MEEIFHIFVLLGGVFSLIGVYRMHKIIQLRYEFYHLSRGTFTLFLLTLVAGFFYRDFLVGIHQITEIFQGLQKIVILLKMEM